MLTYFMHCISIGPRLRKDYFQTEYINLTNMHSLTNIAVLSAKGRDCNEVSDRIINVLIQNYFKTM
jgi:hypothetical protein